MILTERKERKREREEGRGKGREGKGRGNEEKKESIGTYQRLTQSCALKLIIFWNIYFLNYLS